MDILRNPSYDPAHKEVEIAFAGDRDLGDHELRRAQVIARAQIARVGDSLYPEGFVVDGLVPSAPLVTNHIPFSNDWTTWDRVNGVTVTPAAAPDRDGQVVAARVSAVAGADGYLELEVGQAEDGRVFGVDIANISSPAVELALFDGVEEVATLDFVPTSPWARFVVTNDVWSGGASALKLRIRPAFPSATGEILVAHGQLEFKADGEALVDGAYVPTNGEPATRPGAIVAIDTGHAYVGGLPRPVTGATLSFDKMKRTGVDLIYVETAERYVSAFADGSLENPVTGREGNDSVREETRLVTTDTTDAAPANPLDPTAPHYRSRLAVPVYQYDRARGVIEPVAGTNNIDLQHMSGHLPGDRVAPRSLPEDRLDSKATEGQPGLLGALARRTRNTAGEFVVTPTGEPPAITQDMSVTSQVQAKLDPLDGYTPDGRAHYLEEPAVITTALQTTTNTRNNENHVFYDGTDTYTLSKGPIVTIDQLVGVYEVTQTVTRGAVPGSKDDLPNAPVFQVVSVSQGATNYVLGPGGNCFQDGDSLNWSPAGSEPAGGSTYTVTYRYNRTWPADEFTFDDTDVTFIGAKRPVVGLPFVTHYHYGQGRTDLLILAQDGLAVLPGTPSDHPAPPPVPSGAMALFEIDVAYGQLAATFRERFVVGVTMAEQAKMKHKMADLAYDVAVLSAQVNLQGRNNALKGSITDPFIDDRLFDYGNALFPGRNQARVDVATESLRMGSTTTLLKPIVKAAGTTMTPYGNGHAIPRARKVEIAQNAYSQVLSVNPYKNIDLIPPLISLSTQSWWTDWQNNTLAATVTVTGTRFQPNEAGIPILLDGQQVTTATADARGEVSKTFDVTVGRNSIITAVGATGAPTAVAGTNVRWPRRDPLAQTFVLERDAVMLGASLYFGGKDPAKPVVVSLRTTASGLPTDEVLAMVTLFPADVNVGGTPTVITWPSPVRGQADTSFAIVAASDSELYTLQVAELGKRNLASASSYVTSNAYGRGVLAGSSDGRAWTVYQEKDMRLGVDVAQFNANTPYVLLFDPLTFGGGITRFRFNVAQFVAQGATVTWHYTTDGGATWVAFNPASEVALSAAATTVQLRATAVTTDPYAGVAILTQSLELVGYLDRTASSYVQLQSTLLQATTSAKAYVTAKLPTGTQAIPYATTDGGTTWVAGTNNPSATRAVGQDLFELEYSFTLDSGTAFRGRVDLAATDPTVQPEVQQVAFVIL